MAKHSLRLVGDDRTPAAIAKSILKHKLFPRSGSSKAENFEQCLQRWADDGIALPEFVPLLQTLRHLAKAQPVEQQRQRQAIANALLVTGELRLDAQNIIANAKETQGGIHSGHKLAEQILGMPVSPTPTKAQKEEAERALPHYNAVLENLVPIEKDLQKLARKLGIELIGTHGRGSSR